MMTRSIHPFPARMAPEIALDAIPELRSDPLLVIDPMCGSGTVLAVAIARGHTAIGVDIDPLAVMMSRLACTSIDTSKLLQSSGNVVARAECIAGSTPWGDDAETEGFVDYWFGVDQKRQLIALTSAINRLRDADQKLALQLAISRIIVTKTPKASLAADTAHSRPHRVKTASDYDVIEGFARSVNHLARVLNQRSLNGIGTVELGDARVLSTLNDGAADLAVTSPPYLNTLDYLRGHKFALVWFGHTIGDLRKRRSISIGSERALDVDGSDTVKDIVDIVEQQAANPTALRRPMVERFAHDCVGFAGQLHRTLKPGGTAVLVVGNSTLRGNYIKNSAITQTAMESMGFSLADWRERDIPPSRRYMAINAKDAASSITKRMRTEVVLTMVREA